MDTKTRPFTCYYCNKLIENDTECGHISSCGSVLEPCSYKCGSYIPRNMKSKHLRECKNKKSRSMTKLSSNDDYKFDNLENSQTLRDSTARVSASTRLNSANIQSTYKMDITGLLNKLQNLEQFCKQLSQNFLFLKNKHQETLQAEQQTAVKVQMQIEKQQYQNKIMIEGQHNMEMQINGVKEMLKNLHKFQKESETKMAYFQNMLEIIKNVEIDLKLFHKQFQQNQLDAQKTFDNLQEKFNKLKDFVAQENAAICALWDDCKNNIDKLTDEMAAIYEVLNAFKTKHSSIIFDLRAVSQVSSETSDKMEIQERSLEEIKKQISQLTMNIQSLEESASGEVHTSVGPPGYLLWRISNFSQKMENARQNDTVIKSMAFYTHNFGYKIRIHIFLNGIKKWKGRHMIACLHLLKGDYDMLQQWPCFIEGTMTVRDLYNQTNATNFSKYICIKRYANDEVTEEPQESSTQYIFIPHTTLTKQNFIKEDTMFIELRINSINKNLNETEL